MSSSSATACIRREGRCRSAAERVAAIVGDAIGALSFAQVVANNPALAAYADVVPRHREGGGVASGIDVLAANGYAPLAGLRIGLITPPPERRRRRRAAHHRPAAQRARRQAGGAVRPGTHAAAGRSSMPKVPSGVDSGDGLTVHQPLRRNAAADAGDASTASTPWCSRPAGRRRASHCISTMGYALEAVAEARQQGRDIRLPSSLTGRTSSAASWCRPLLDPERRPFTAYYPLPVRHGMSVVSWPAVRRPAQHLDVHPEVIQMQRLPARCSGSTGWSCRGCRRRRICAT